jgi:hypothetical protein
LAVAERPGPDCYWYLQWLAGLIEGCVEVIRDQPRDREARSGRYLFFVEGLEQNCRIAQLGLRAPQNAYVWEWASAVSSCASQLDLLPSRLSLVENLLPRERAKH